MTTPPTPKTLPEPAAEFGWLRATPGFPFNKETFSIKKEHRPAHGEKINLYTEPQLIAALAAQPPAVAAPEELSDQQIIDRCNAAGVMWIPPQEETDDWDDIPGSAGFPGGFDMCSMDEMRRLLRAQPPAGQQDRGEAIPEGCTPADAQVLRAANGALAAENGYLRQALRFYAAGSHFITHADGGWDSVSGEPENFLENEEGTATVEDGTIAAMALRGELKDWGDDAPPLCKGEPEELIITPATAGEATAAQGAHEPVLWMSPLALGHLLEPGGSSLVCTLSPFAREGWVAFTYAATPVRGLPLTEERIQAFGDAIDRDASAWPRFLTDQEKRVRLVRAVEAAHGISSPAPGGDGES